MTAPVQSFSAEMIEFFRLAARKEIIIELPTMKDADRLRFRLYQLRKAMREENHHLVKIADTVSLHLKDKPPRMIGHLADQGFIAALQKAGVTVTEEMMEETELQDVKDALEKPKAQPSAMEKLLQDKDYLKKES